VRPTFPAQQQGASPAPATAAGYGTPGSAQRPPQQQQYMSPQQQQPYMSPQQQPYMSPQQQQQQQQQYMSPQQGSQQQQLHGSQQSPGAGLSVRVVPAPPNMPHHLGLKSSFSENFVKTIKQLPFRSTDRYAFRGRTACTTCVCRSPSFWYC
jgi:hypothetical protein